MSLRGIHINICLRGIKYANACVGFVSSFERHLKNVRSEVMIGGKIAKKEAV